MRKRIVRFQHGYFEKRLHVGKPAALIVTSYNESFRIMDGIIRVDFDGMGGVIRVETSENIYVLVRK